jgi:hypothetical protein
MIKVALKHYIYDYCIGLIFDNISSNFINYDNKIKVGDRFEYIKTNPWGDFDEITSYDCIITKITKNHIYFSAEKYEFFEDGKTTMHESEGSKNCYSKDKISRMKK